jgi:hypothetical protein
MENFMLKFEHNGQPHILEVRPWVQQYKAVYKVKIEQHDITFEPDEEGQLRAVSDTHKEPGHIDAGLLENVARRIEEHLEGTDTPENT